MYNCMIVLYVESSMSSSRMNFHPKLVNETELDVMRSKSHLIQHMIQHKIGQDLLLQVRGHRT